VLAKPPFISLEVTANSISPDFGCGNKSLSFLITSHADGISIEKLSVSCNVRAEFSSEEPQKQEVSNKLDKISINILFIFLIFLLFNNYFLFILNL
jgi:hypothetical protein